MYCAKMYILCFLTINSDYIYTQHHIINWPMPLFILIYITTIYLAMELKRKQIINNN